jgi:hypothetical protein
MRPAHGWSLKLKYPIIYLLPNIIENSSGYFQKIWPEENFDKYQRWKTNMCPTSSTKRTIKEHMFSCLPDPPRISRLTAEINASFIPPPSDLAIGSAGESGDTR